VTSTVPFRQKFIDMKFPLTYYQGWYKNVNYLPGDVVFDSDYKPWICKTDACDTTDPSTLSQTAWKAFDLTNVKNNKADWSAIDVNIHNYLEAPESTYSSFNEGVICKAPTVDPLAFGDRVCDTSTLNTP
jgi:hypothetical protein